MAGVYTVAQMNSYIKNMFRQDFVLSRVDVRGEVSNCKYHTSGHIYFTLKDELGTLAAVMFAGQAKNLSFRLENGMKVVVSGIYITAIKSARGGIEKPEPKKGFFKRLFKK